MTRYRLATNGTCWVVDYRYWWWPFWLRHEVATGVAGTFATEADARAAVERWRQEAARTPYRIVKEV